jgi:NADPH-dependent ferric siderophore reductase
MRDTSVPMRVFAGEVVSAADLSATLRRIVIGGPGVADYLSTGVGDEYIRLVFPAPGTREPLLPAVAGDALDYSTIDLDLLRTYTVRRFDADRGEVTVDFVVHGHGVATRWAQAARPGDLIGLNSPIGMYHLPEGATWQVLVADLAGLPALARILEQTPPTLPTRVVAEVPGPADEIALRPGPKASVTWLHGGNGIGPSRMEEALRSVQLPPGQGYVWVAGEARELRSIRKYLRRERGLAASAFTVVGYWTDAAEQWHERWEALDPAIKAELEEMWQSDRDEADIEEEYDDRLTALGL